MRHHDGKKSMKTLALVSWSVLALCVATGASAADLPRKSVAPVLARASTFSWTGFYFGLNAGYGWTSDKTISIGPGVFSPAVGALLIINGAAPGSLPLDSKGFAGGLQVGYNYQFPNTAFVVGLEADLQYTNTRSSGFFSGPPTIFHSASTKTDFLGTVRGRLGFAIVPELLLYATGGLAYGHVRTTFGGGSVIGVVSPVATDFLSSNIKVGYAIGGGVEYALTRNFTLKGEYLYYDLGKVSGQTSPLTNAAPPPINFSVSQKVSGHIVRAGVNYKF
jgi:outer membrane immunogenic protein